MRLSKIAKDLEIEFNAQDLEVVAINTLQDAKENELSFFNDAKHIDSLKTTKACAVLIKQEHAHMLPSRCIALVCKDPYLSLAYASKYFAHKPNIDSTDVNIGKECNIDKSVVFGSNVEIEDGATIMAHCYIGDGVKIGRDTLIYPNVTIYHGCKIGDECTIHSGSVIGSDGFGFAHTKDGSHVKIYQNGIVVLQNRVEIGANCTIDRAVFGATIISEGSKLDNLIQIAHNCKIGANTLIASQVGLAGSTTLGQNVVMGGQSATAGHLSVGDFSTIAGKAGVTKSLEGKKTYAGFPAVEISVWRRIQATLSRLAKRKS